VAAIRPPAKETTMRRTLAAVTLLLAVGTAGCGSHDDPTVATAGSGTPKASAGGSTAANGQDTKLKYSQCMRDHGMTWFPDPGPDGGLGVKVPDGTDQNKLEKAQEACKAYAPGANRSGKLSDEDLNKLRQMSQCVRDHGFSKYPDPDSNGGISVNDKTLGVAGDDPAFLKALQECRKYLPPRKKS
jgi:hypothetical protein